MNKIRPVLLIAVLLTVSLFSSAQNASQKANNKYSDGAMFYYRTGSILLYNTFKTNERSLTWLDGVVKANRTAIMSGKAHFEIFGYIPSSEVGSKRAINNASLQGSVLRAYLKTQYGISHSFCTFAIDTTQGLSDVVQLQLVSGGVPAYANTQICYSENRTAATISQAVAEYKNGVPYTSYLMFLARRDTDIGSGSATYALRDKPTAPQEQEWESFADTAKLSQLAAIGGISLFVKTPDGSFLPATIADVDNGVNILYTRNPAGAYVFASAADIKTIAASTSASFPSASYVDGVTAGLVRTEPYVEGKGLNNQGFRDYPIFGIKTNTLYWLAGLPNFEMEFYMGKMVSLNVEGQYTWLSEILGQEKAYYVWGVSAELRFWFRANKRFEGWYMGLYGHTGQYDFKFGDIGNQGDYYGGGLSVGYLLPLGKHFNLEFGLAGGYVQYVNSDYKWDGKKNVPVNKLLPTQTKWGIFPTKARVSLVWKF